MNVKSAAKHFSTVLETLPPNDRNRYRDFLSVDCVTVCGTMAPKKKTWSNMSANVLPMKNSAMPTIAEIELSAKSSNYE